MEQNKYFNFFISHIKTKEQVLEFVSQVDKAKEQIYKNEGVALSKKLDKMVSDQFRIRIQQAEEKGYLPKSPKEEDQFLSQLSEYILSLSVIKMTLAFVPDEQFLDKMEAFVAKKEGEKTIFDITLDEGIVAGAIFEAAGEYRDYSVSRQVDELLKNSKLITGEV